MAREGAVWFSIGRPLGAAALRASNYGQGALTGQAGEGLGGVRVQGRVAGERRVVVEGRGRVVCHRRPGQEVGGCSSKW